MGLINVALRGAQFLWALLIIALVGNMIATAFAGNPAIINYDMFVGVFSMLSLFYLVATAVKDGFGAPIVTIALDILNALFYFCGAVATAAYLGARSCSNDGYTRSNFITNGSANTESRCRKAQASTTFLFFNFFLFAATAVLSAMHGRSEGVNLRGGIGGIRRGGPAMSQV
ncbi:Membrane-associating domain-containing protein [Elsinoe fawcettii]|nr:Membrane-associating domain-containing protein [Elsinoe fawcettii]